MFDTKIPLAWILETLFVLYEVAQVSLTVTVLHDISTFQANLPPYIFLSLCVTSHFDIYIYIERERWEQSTTTILCCDLMCIMQHVSALTESHYQTLQSIYIKITCIQHNKV